MKTKVLGLFAIVAASAAMLTSAVSVQAATVSTAPWSAWASKASDRLAADSDETKIENSGSWVRIHTNGSQDGQPTYDYANNSNMLGCVQVPYSWKGDTMQMCTASDAQNNGYGDQSIGFTAPYAGEWKIAGGVQGKGYGTIQFEFEILVADANNNLTSLYSVKKKYGDAEETFEQTVSLAAGQTVYVRAGSMSKSDGGGARAGVTSLTVTDANNSAVSYNALTGLRTPGTYAPIEMPEEEVQEQYKLSLNDTKAAVDNSRWSFAHTKKVASDATSYADISWVTGGMDINGGWSKMKNGVKISRGGAHVWFNPSTPEGKFRVMSRGDDNDAYQNVIGFKAPKAGAYIFDLWAQNIGEWVDANKFYTTGANMTGIYSYKKSGEAAATIFDRVTIPGNYNYDKASDPTVLANAVTDRMVLDLEKDEIVYLTVQSGDGNGYGEIVLMDYTVSNYYNQAEAYSAADIVYDGLDSDVFTLYYQNPADETTDALYTVRYDEAEDGTLTTWIPAKEYGSDKATTETNIAISGDDVTANLKNDYNAVLGVRVPEAGVWRFSTLAENKSETEAATINTYLRVGLHSRDLVINDNCKNSTTALNAGEKKVIDVVFTAEELQQLFMQLVSADAQVVLSDCVLTKVSDTEVSEYTVIRAEYEDNELVKAELSKDAASSTATEKKTSSVKSFLWDMTKLSPLGNSVEF